MRHMTLITLGLLAAACGSNLPPADQFLSEHDLEEFGDVDADAALGSDAPTADAATDVAAPDAAADVDICLGKNCDDSNACTDDSCDPAKGCVHAANAALCDDGDACTVGDACAAKKCVPGTPKTCTAMDQCHDAGGCDAKTGACSQPKKPDATACTISATCSGAATCQAGTCLPLPAYFDATYGSAGIDAGLDVAALSDGFALSGNTTSQNLPGGSNSPQASAGAQDFWLARTDFGGTLLWSRTFGGTGDDDVNAMVAASDGGFALVGQSTSAALAGGSNGAQTNAGSTDIWFVRTDASGNLIWSSLFGATGDEDAFDVATVPAGGFVIAGLTTSKFVAGGTNGAQGNAGKEDFLLVRTDTNGKLLWSRTFGGSGYDEAKAVVALADGGFAIAGYTDSPSLPGGSNGIQAAKGVGDYWLVRTDASGTLLWSRTYGGTGDDIATALVALPDGGFAIAGGASSDSLPGGGNGVLANNGSRDFWLVRTDVNGTMLWSQNYGGGGTETAVSLLTLADGGFALGGYSASETLPGGAFGDQPGAGNYDGWLVRTDASGILAWSRTYGGSGQDDGNALAAVTGGFALVGDTMSKGAGDADFWLVVTDAFGNGNCASAAPCAAMAASPTPCDDGNPCTMDACDAIHSGCFHPNVVDGAWCPTKGTCSASGSCAAGACVSAGQKLFTAAWGGSGDDGANALQVLPGGDFLILGATKSATFPGGSNGTQTTKGIGDVIVSRTDSAGTLLWAKAYGGSADDYAVGGFQLADGGFLFVADTQSPSVPTGGGLTLNTAGGNDLWLIRTNSTGTLQWSKTYGSTGNDAAEAALMLPDGGYVLLAETNSTSVPGGANGPQSNAGKYDLWLVRTDSGGTVQWSTTYGGTEDEFGGSSDSLKRLPDDGLVFCGRSQSASLPGGSNGAQGNLGSADGWLVRTNAAGTLLWSKTYGGAGLDNLLAVTPLGDGGFAATGSSDSTSLPGGANGPQTTAGSGDVWVVRTDASGTLLWSRTYGGTGADGGASILPLADGGMALSGFTKSPSVPGGAYGGQKGNATNGSGWLIRTNATGTLLWSRASSAGSGEAWNAAAPLSDGGFALAGTANSLNNGWETELVRADAFGNTDCTSSGTCATKSTCDDSNPCTADACNADQTGCFHTQLPNGTSCGATKTCSNGACQ